MGRRSYSGEKRRKELARKAKREAKAERKQQQGQGEAGGGPPIDWESQVGGTVSPPEGEVEETDDADENDENEESQEAEGRGQP